MRLVFFLDKFSKTVGRELDYKALGFKKLSGPEWKSTTELAISSTRVEESTRLPRNGLIYA